MHGSDAVRRTGHLRHHPGGRVGARRAHRCRRVPRLALDPAGPGPGRPPRRPVARAARRALGRIPGARPGPGHRAAGCRPHDQRHRRGRAAPGGGGGGPGGRPAPRLHRRPAAGAAGRGGAPGHRPGPPVRALGALVRRPRGPRRRPAPAAGGRSRPAPSPPRWARPRPGPPQPAVPGAAGGHARSAASHAGRWRMGRPARPGRHPRGRGPPRGRAGAGGGGGGARPRRRAGPRRGCRGAGRWWPSPVPPPGCPRTPPSCTSTPSCVRPGRRRPCGPTWWCGWGRRARPGWSTSGWRPRAPLEIVLGAPGWSDPAGTAALVSEDDPTAFLEAAWRRPAGPAGGWLDAWQAASTAAAKALADELDGVAGPSEPAVARAVVAALPDGRPAGGVVLHADPRRRALCRPPGRPDHHRQPRGQRHRRRGVHGAGRGPAIRGADGAAGRRHRLPPRQQRAAGGGRAGMSIWCAWSSTTTGVASSRSCPRPPRWPRRGSRRCSARPTASTWWRWRPPTASAPAGSTRRGRRHGRQRSDRRAAALRVLVVPTDRAANVAVHRRLDDAMAAAVERRPRGTGRAT